MTKTDISNYALSLIGESRNQLTDFDTDTTSIARQCRLHYQQTLEELVRVHSWNCCKGRKVLDLFPSSITFSDAGESGVNGEWEYVSTDSNGYKSYTYGAFTAEFDSGNGWWSIVDGGSTEYYRNTDSNSLTPPEDGWTVVGSGTSPAPIGVYAYPYKTWSYRFSLPVDCVRPLHLMQDSSTTQFFRPQSEWLVEGRTILCNSKSPVLIYDSAPLPENMDSLFINAFYMLLASKIVIPINGDAQTSMMLRNQFEQSILPEARRVNSFEGHTPAVVDSEWLDATYYGDSFCPPFSQSSYGSIG